MLFQKREFIPIPSLKDDFIVFHMKKSTSAKSELIFPFHYRPFSIFKNILYYTNHFSRCKFICKHFMDRRFTYHRFIRNLMVYRIFGIQLRKTNRIGGIKAVYPLFQNFFRRHNHA